MRILALDVGKRRIGIAISDLLGVTCRPYDTIDRNKEAYLRIQMIVQSEHVQKVIVGLPLHLNGSEGEQAKDVRLFAERLTSFLEIPIEYRDERLTTVEAKQRAGRQSKNRKQEKRRLDSVAAAVLLEDYLKEQ